MKYFATWRCVFVLMLAALGGCATKDMPGYQNTYQGHDIPPQLLSRINAKFRQHGLANAAVVRDSVGRVRLAGNYRNEDDVDVAFTIVQSIVGIKSTSPFYPQDVRERRWEAEAGRALAQYAAAQRAQAASVGVRRAIVIGINSFQDPRIPPIQGEDDARLMAEQLSKYGYRVTSLFGPSATKSGIELAIRLVERDLGPNDALFIYVSSHGTPPVPSSQGSDGRKMSIVAYDSGESSGRSGGDYVDQALNLQRTSVKDSLLQNLAHRPTRTTRVLVDTCYSGEILRGVPDDSRQYILSQNGGQIEREGVSIASWSGGAVASKGIQFVGGDTKASSTPAPFASRANYTVITATSEGQKAWGPDAKIGVFKAPVAGTKELKGSFFTQTFAAWLQVHNGQVIPAFEQASAFTNSTVQRETSGRERQTPRLFSTIPAAEDNVAKF